MQDQRAMVLVPRDSVLVTRDLHFVLATSEWTGVVFISTQNWIHEGMCWFFPSSPFWGRATQGNFGTKSHTTERSWTQVSWSFTQRIWNVNRAKKKTKLFQWWRSRKRIGRGVETWGSSNRRCLFRRWSGVIYCLKAKAVDKTGEHDARQGRNLGRWI